MTASDTDLDTVASREKAATRYRRDAVQASVRVQVERLKADLRAHLRLSDIGDPRARGAALAAAHATLVLASSAVVAETDRHLRRAALDAALPFLVQAGQGHLVGLVKAALAHDGDPALQARGVERPQ